MGIETKEICVILPTITRAFILPLKVIIAYLYFIVSDYSRNDGINI